MQHVNYVKTVFFYTEQYGGWNTSGCNLTLETNTTIHCQCDHLTHFGILMVRCGMGQNGYID